jgi:hypothetical protein
MTEDTTHPRPASLSAAETASTTGERAIYVAYVAVIFIMQRVSIALVLSVDGLSSSESLSSPRVRRATAECG